jgi:hypothetical protein
MLEGCFLKILRTSRRVIITVMAIVTVKNYYEVYDRFMTFTIVMGYGPWLSQLSQLLQELKNPLQKSASVEWCQTL